MAYRTYIIGGKSKIHKGRTVADLADADTVLIEIKKWEQISLSISSTLPGRKKFQRPVSIKDRTLIAECYFRIPKNSKD